MIYIDVTDFLVFLERHLTVTGIQRVLSKLISESHANAVGRVAYTCIDSQTREIRRFDEKGLCGLVELLDKSLATRREVDARVERLLTSARSWAPEVGDVFIVPGAFWTVQDLSQTFATLRELGVSTCIYLHDLIQIDNPEFVGVDAPRVFALQFSAALQHTSFVVTNSEFVLKELRRYCEDYELPHLPAESVWPGMDADLEGARRTEPQAHVAEVAARAPYVLAVGTLEIRKNHPYLLQVWKILLQHESLFVPNLVLAGRWGWGIDEFHGQLDATRNLDGRILVINDATDADLAHLYDGCLFTVFPSFVEGWGLPVGESLAHGKLCVASGTSSIPEVGGDLALYIDPLNVRDGVEVIGGLLRDRDRLEALTERVRREFRPRSWATFSSELLEAVDRLSSGPRREFRPVVLRERTWLRFARPHSVSETRDEGGGAVNATAACVSGWHGAEDWGRWTTESGGRLVFRLASPGRYVMVFGYNLPSGVGARAVRITHDGEVRFDGVVAGPHGVVAIETPTAEDGLVEIVFSGRGARLGSDDTDLRAVLLGLSRLFVYRTDTLEQRVMGMQDMQLQTLQIA